MAGIDDWYLDYAHRHELTPGYSVDDDVPDPFVFGEVPGPDWVVPPPRTPERPGRDGSKATRGQSTKANRGQSQAKNTAKKPPVAARRQSGVRLGRSRRVVDWRQFALRWLRTNPGGSNRELMTAVEEAGFLPIVKAEIAAIRAELAASKKKAPRRKTLPRARRTAPPPPAAIHVPPVRYCDSCGLAVTNDGRCRC